MLELEQVLDEVRRSRTRRVSPAGRRVDQLQLQASTPRSGSYHVRRWSDDSGLLAIDRDNEYENSVAAAEAGVGAKRVRLPAGAQHDGDRMDRGGPLTAARAAAREAARTRSPRPAADCTAPRASATTSTCSRSSRATSGSCATAASGCRTPTSSFEPHVAAIRDALAVRDEGTVPCNNDLLAENFMLTPAGLSPDRLRVLGQQRPVLRARQHLERVEPVTRQLEQLVAAYYGRAARHKVARAGCGG